MQIREKLPLVSGRGRSEEMLLFGIVLKPFDPPHKGSPQEKLPEPNQSGFYQSFAELHTKKHSPSACSSFTDRRNAHLQPCLVILSYLRMKKWKHADETQSQGTQTCQKFNK